MRGNAHARDLAAARKELLDKVEQVVQTNRLLLAPTTTAAGQSATYGFVVNVRAREGQPTEHVAAGYPGLDLYFSGPRADPPEVAAIGFALVDTAEWGAVKNAMTAGDWVLIQFGHNDKTTSSATFQANITQMVKDARPKARRRSWSRPRRGRPSAEARSVTKT